MNVQHRLQHALLLVLLAAAPTVSIVAAAAPMGAADMAGRWRLQYLPINGPSAWVRGTANIAADGSLNGLLTTARISPLSVPFEGAAWVGDHGLGSFAFVDDVDGDAPMARVAAREAAATSPGLCRRTRTNGHLSMKGSVGFTEERAMPFHGENTR